MKKIFLLLVAAGGAFSAIAQTTDANNNMDNTSTQAKLDSLNKHNYKKEAYLSRWVIDVNLLVGVLTQDIRKTNTDPNYANGIDLNTGTLKFNEGKSYGGEVQLGYFFGKKGHFGVGAGFMYLYQTGDLTLDQFSVQYQSLDQNGNTFRQVITADGPVKEKLVVQNMNIPIMLKYKTRFSKHFGFTADLGILYNVKMQNAYTTNAQFDYEAIYQFTSDVTGAKVPVYDYAETPSKYDWLITKNQVGYHAGGISGQVLADEINNYRNQGYNVGLGVTADKTKGTTNYSQGSLGFMARPQVTYFFSDHVALMLGVYYMYQPEKNVPKNGYMLTNEVGSYTSLTNSVEKSIYQSFGGNLGVRFYLGKYHGAPEPELKVTSEDSTNPSVCGVMDGTITLHQFNSGDSVTVDYIYNGNPQPTIRDTVTEFGTIRMTKLGAGRYTGIVVSRNGESAAGTPITLVNPSLGIYSQSSTDPSANNACDGTIRMHGLHPGLTLTVNYNMNGTPQKAIKGVIAPDGTLKLTGLCPGKYTNIVASNNTCSVNGLDVTLNNPPVPVVPQIKSERPDVTTPILFDFNMTTIHPVSYPVLMEAVIELNEDENSNIVIDGYTDNIGKVGYNKTLSNKRANAVRTYLTNNGISAKRLKSVGHGLDNPVAPNDTPEGRAKNRRVTMTLQHTK
jgi:outer membrane protein OmpA-like peptidoglycan-associated protein